MFYLFIYCLLLIIFHGWNLIWEFSFKTVGEFVARVLIICGNEECGHRL